MNKQATYDFLTLKNISYKAYEHEAVFTVEAANALNLPNPECGAKNLFLRDDKKRNYYLFTLKDDRTVNIKTLQAMIGSRKLQFASEEDLYSYMKLIRGAVTPLGVLNDEACAVKVYIDAYFKDNTISVHPNDNTATIYLACNDLISLIREHGSQAEYIDFPFFPDIIAVGGDNTCSQS